MVEILALKLAPKYEIKVYSFFSISEKITVMHKKVL